MFVVGAVQVASRIPAVLGLVPKRTPLRSQLSATRATADRAVFPGIAVSLRETTKFPGGTRTLLRRQSGHQASVGLIRDFASLPHGRFALIEKEVFPRRQTECSGHAMRPCGA